MACLSSVLRLQEAGCGLGRATVALVPSSTVALFLFLFLFLFHFQTLLEIYLSDQMTLVKYETWPNNTRYYSWTTQKVWDLSDFVGFYF
jgi:hypothetical protein